MDATLTSWVSPEQYAAIPGGPASSPVQTEDCPCQVVITTRAGLPPLLPQCYEQAKLWAKGRTCLALGRTHKLRKFRDGYLVLDGKRIVNAYLEPVRDYGPPYAGNAASLRYAIKKAIPATSHG